MDTSVPALAADGIAQLKDAVSEASDAALACAEPSVDAKELQQRLAEALHANLPEPPPGAVVSAEHRADEDVKPYGKELDVQVRRPSIPAGVLTFNIRQGIQCGEDTLLLVYELRGTAWVQTLRWQSPRLTSISDAFGDFFVSAFVVSDLNGTGEVSKWRLAVAHGTPWCTSRFSGFDIDLLEPGADPSSPRVYGTPRGPTPRGFRSLDESRGERL